MAKKKKDTYSYKGWLVSDYFWKRALAIFGYHMAITAIIYGALIIIWIFFMMIFMMNVAMYM